MASKKYLLLLAVLSFAAFDAFSQVKIGTTYDSTQIPQKRMPQHNEFLQGVGNFPAKPRNQWELGLKLGVTNISGDVPSALAFPSFGLHIRKAFGYVFSLRLEYAYGNAKGLSWLPSENYYKNKPWFQAGYSAPFRSPAGPIVSSHSLEGGNPNDPTEFVYYNYKTRVQDLSLQGVVTLNNIRFHKSKTGFNMYLFGGGGPLIYRSFVNARNEAGGRYDFGTIAATDFDNRGDTKDALKELLDDSYESRAERHDGRRGTLFQETFRWQGNLGLGLALKINNRLNIAIEDRITFVKDDLLDGQRWQEAAVGDPVMTRDFDLINRATIGLNINLGAKSVEPLWWLNPLDYAYSEIRNPRLMRLPKPVLPDSDGDGVTDQFDQEQTPQGCPVDSHGVSKDTDGDGVPDCKDKELITPTYCQPVDADGVGKCPVACPDSTCPGWGRPPVDECSTKLGDLPSVSFRAGSNALTTDAQAVLSNVASRLRNNPECKIVVTGYCSSNKKEQQLSWDHVNKVITHLVEKEGLSADRFIFKYGEEGDCSTVDLRAAAAGEEGPNTVTPPHPNLRKN
jgi:outer membrane protein OmpA-like peptidoglycan-associated protein